MNALDELMWTWVSGENPEENAFKCRWADCFISLNDAAHLEAHLEEHVTHISTKWFHGALIACGIYGCTVHLNDPVELQSHIRLHIHHALCQKNGLNLLRQSSTSLNHCFFQPNAVVDQCESAIICQWQQCGVQFRKVSEFLQHLKNHAFCMDPVQYQDGSFCFECKWENACESRFPDRFNLSRHVISHSHCRTLACPFCGQHFSSSQKLIEHSTRRISDENSSKYVCYLCQKVFSSSKFLRDHCERHVKKFACPHEQCQYVANRESDMNNHIEGVHCKNRPFQCEQCGKSYVKKSDLSKHVASHSGLMYSCPHCNVEFAWQKQLKHHLQTHDPDYIKSPYLCHICGSTYQRGSALSKHLRTFHKLTVPPGFTRFQFKKCSDNMFRLETERILADEITYSASDGSPMCQNAREYMV
ncbi:unnamed protein product [Bursaphelenchus xylophilus]|uniref:(pine wood nematode) hypothetical protein n=1 Tax=Bursaphelenchus xylophilus TaxID=6326 RepID=A0A1I7S0D6_BURXY|nr:unnamed protein product [Bursaphelenchus xylophilus]CAG9132219.1 unnamed protein product [Bursaphelenchus xylophilus]